VQGLLLLALVLVDADDAGDAQVAESDGAFHGVGL
jgi:hypothetical protein